MLCCPRSQENTILDNYGQYFCMTSAREQENASLNGFLSFLICAIGQFLEFSRGIYFQIMFFAIFCCCWYCLHLLCMIVSWFFNLVWFQCVQYIVSNVRILSFPYLSSLWIKYHRLQKTGLISKEKLSFPFWPCDNCRLTWGGQKSAEQCSILWLAESVSLSSSSLIVVRGEESNWKICWQIK